MIVLADTSVWVEWLRRGTRGTAADMDRLVGEDAVLVCGPVAAELVAGAAPDDQGELWTLLTSLPWADLDAFAWRETGIAAGALRRRGTSVAVTDLAIAVCAVRAAARLWTRDVAFDRIADVLPLKLYEAA